MEKKASAGVVWISGKLKSYKTKAEAGNILKAVSSDSDSLDIIVSFVEQT